MAEPARVLLTIPSDPEYLRLARLAASDAGSRVGMSVEEIEDLRIAVDELSYAISEGADGAPIALVYTLHDDGVEITGECEGAAEAEPSDLARAIVGAVVDVCDLDAHAGTRRFRLVKRVLETL
jgi:anti-sigma regulatory factor (Ser/Thr protein kinase)